MDREVFEKFMSAVNSTQAEKEFTKEDMDTAFTIAELVEALLYDLIVSAIVTAETHMLHKKAGIC